jgi:hypothetical protein
MLLLTMGFGVLMGWALVKFFMFSNHSNLRIGILLIIIKKTHLEHFWIIWFGGSSSNMVYYFVDWIIIIQNFKIFIIGLL